MSGGSERADLRRPIAAMKPAPAAAATGRIGGRTPRVAYTAHEIGRARQLVAGPADSVRSATNWNPNDTITERQRSGSRSAEASMRVGRSGDRAEVLRSRSRKPDAPVAEARDQSRPR
jgi:hypothetical protein